MKKNLKLNSDQKKYEIYLVKFLQHLCGGEQ